MEEHGYAFSYTQYGIIDKDSHDRGFVIGGKDRVTVTPGARPRN